MKVSATAKFVRMSPRKTRLVVDLVRGMTITQARHQLQFSLKAAAVPVLKVLNSAVANAQNNNGLDVSDFIVTAAYVNEGPTFYRHRPRAQGRSAPIRKRMSHITVEVGPKSQEDGAVARGQELEGTDEKPSKEKTPEKKTTKKSAVQKAAKNV